MYGLKAIATNFELITNLNWLFNYTRCYKPFFKLKTVTKTNKNKILNKVKKAEHLISKGNSDLSAISNDIQHLFDEEVDVNWSTDGAVITSINGEVGFLADFVNGL